MRPAIEFAIRDLKLNSGHSIASSATLFLLSLSGAVSSLSFTLKLTPNIPFFIFGIIVALASAFATSHTYTALRTDLPVYFGIGATSSTLRNILLLETLLPIIIGTAAGSTFGIIAFDIAISQVGVVPGFQLIGVSVFASLMGGSIGTFAQTMLRLQTKGENR